MQRNHYEVPDWLFRGMRRGYNPIERYALADYQRGSETHSRSVVDTRSRRGRQCKSNPQHALLAVMFMIIVGTILLFLSLITPSYHKIVINFIVSVLTLDIGLWEVQASGDCSLLVGRRNTATRFIQHFCLSFIHVSSGKTLATLESVLCMAPPFLHDILGESCASITRLRVASYVLIVALCLATALNIITLFTLVIYWAARPTNKIRTAALLSQSAGAMFLLCGVSWYLIDGGVHLNIVTFSYLFSHDGPNISLSYGFLVCVLAVMWNTLMPIALYMSTHVVVHSADTDDDETRPLLEGFKALGYRW